MSEQTTMIDATWYTFKGTTVLAAKAGRCRTERVVPPAGEKYAFDCEVWDHRVEIAVSPTGRSVRVYIDGEKVFP